MSTENQERSVVKVYTGGVASKATRIESSKGVPSFSLPQGVNYKLWLIPKVATKTGNIKSVDAEFYTDYLPSQIFIAELLGYTPEDLDNNAFHSVYVDEKFKPNVIDMLSDLVYTFIVPNGQTLVNNQLHQDVIDRRDIFIENIFNLPLLNNDINYKNKTVAERFQIFQNNSLTNAEYADAFCTQYLIPLVSQFIEDRTDIYIWSTATASLMINTPEVEHYSKGVLRNKTDFPEDFSTFRAMGDIDQLLSWIKFISSDNNKIFRDIRFNEIFDDKNKTVKDTFNNWVTNPIKGSNRSTVSSPRELVFFAGFENTTTKDYTTIASADWKLGSYQVKYSKSEKSIYYKITTTAREGASNIDTDFVLIIAKMNGDTVPDVRKNLDFNSATPSIMGSQNMIDRNLILDLLKKLASDTAFGSSATFRNILNVENELEFFRDYVMKSQLLETEFFDDAYYDIYKSKLDDLGIVSEKFANSGNVADKLNEVLNNNFGGVGNPMPNNPMPNINQVPNMNANPNPNNLNPSMGGNNFGVNGN